MNHPEYITRKSCITNIMNRPDYIDVAISRNGIYLSYTSRVHNYTGWHRLSECSHAVIEMLYLSKMQYSSPLLQKTSHAQTSPIMPFPMPLLCVPPCWDLQDLHHVML